MRKEIRTDKGAAPKGPYSQAIAAEGQTVYVSGQGPVDPATGEFVLGSFREQAELVFNNIAALLEAAGTSWAHVVRVGIFLADLDNFPEMNEIYQKFLTAPYPARTTVQVGLPPDMLIEVDCIAVVPEEG
jgi:2-iminobutanoate/2-iminopropanoate deaminase